MTENYARELAHGRMYEEWIAKRMWWTVARTFEAQKYGDTTCRTEIKFDKLLHKTRNLFIEMAECPRPGGNKYAAGIFKPCRRFAIGDCRELFLFDLPAIEVLRRYCNKHQQIFKSPRIKESLTATGAIISVQECRNICRGFGIHEYRWQEHPLACLRNRGG